MALSRETEDRLVGAILLLIALPAMTAGIVIGVRHDDKALVIGCVLIIIMLPYFSRSTLHVAYERTLMFGWSKKPKHTLVLSVAAVADSNRVGVLQVVRGGPFRTGDILRITEIYPLRGSHGEEMKVEILKNGRVYSAGTLRIRNGTFEPARRLRIEAVDAVPVS